ncbi:hypothetical protein C8A00DRAFT_45518 [Chaetomidium leptoderma]|uniref:Protein kinase domain-containing protein n=1 Tax=Chaetomidium leptoderma TaxID=669021 RepID=A0AAN6VH72_9PEZI|nr:hypothetical protein C8A00DRAFT_45518 [Chaetomidium leptoderma]
MDEQQQEFEYVIDPHRVRPPKLKTIYFKFQTRIVSATGTQADREHPHVLRLRTNPSLLATVVQAAAAAASLLPLQWFAAAAWPESAYPEWFLLPPRIVLKREMDDHPRSFDAEHAVYDRLGPLQGEVIPRLLGCIEYDGARALLLSDIGGVCLADPGGGLVLQGRGDDEGQRARELGRLLGVALGALAAMGVSHDDTKSDNFHLVGEGESAKIMVVDLEQVDLDLSKEDAAWAVRENVETLVGRWREHLECLREDGFLPREGKAQAKPLSVPW